MKRYKLTTKKLTTYNGHQWGVGVEQVIDKPGNALCSDQVFHFYDSPRIAILLNPAHAGISDPVVWEVDCDEVAHDGVKGGSKRMTIIKKVKIPHFTNLQKRIFAIKCALAVYSAEDFATWARDFISGKDRTKKSAAAAAYVAAVAADAAARAAAARAAAYAAVDAADAADSAYAAYVAAYAAAAHAGDAEKIRKAINAAAKFAANFKG